MSALAMIARCFRHQHPEAFGRRLIGVPWLPKNMRDGGDDVYQTSVVLAEEAMGLYAEPVAEE